MYIKSKKRVAIGMSVAAAFTLFTVTGCGHGNGSNMSTEDYKNAAMGSKMSPEQEAAMHAAVAKQQAADAARQPASTAPH